MIDRYKACLAPTMHRPYLLHAFRDRDALTVRLLRPSEERPPKRDADLNTHLSMPLQPFSFSHVVSGDPFDRPGTAWEVTTGITFSVSALGSLRPRQSWTLAVDSEERFVRPFERFSLTDGTKQSRGVLLRMLNLRQVAMVASCFGADSLDECQILLVGGMHGCWANVPFTHVFEPLSGQEVTDTQAPDFFPRAVISGPATVAAGGVAKFSLSFVDASTGAVVSNGSRSVPVRVEATSGYLVDSIVYPRKGLAAFRWMALGLTKGDRLRIKSNWGTWSGDHEIEVRVA